MIVNVPNIDICNGFVNPYIVNECVIEDSHLNDYCNDTTISFFNAIKEIYCDYSTEEVIANECNVYRYISDVQKIKLFLEKAPTIFASSTEQFVLSSFIEMRDGLMNLSFDLLATDISIDEECLFVYAQKKDIKLFFNLFFERDSVETLVNVSTPSGKYVIESDIENTIQRLSEIV